jgi:hypothetical protein
LFRFGGYLSSIVAQFLHNIDNIWSGTGIKGKAKAKRRQAHFLSGSQKGKYTILMIIKALGFTRGLYLRRLICTMSLLILPAYRGLSCSHTEMFQQFFHAA